MGEQLDPGQGEGWVAPDVSAEGIRRREIADKLKNGENVNVKELSETDAQKEDAATARRRELRQKIENGTLDQNATTPELSNASELSPGTYVDRYGTLHRGEKK